jgi:hypothetical protein
MSDEVFIPKQEENNSKKIIIIISLVVIGILLIGLGIYFALSKLAIRGPGDGVDDPYDLNSISYVGTFKDTPTKEVYGVRNGDVYSNGSLSITNLATTRGNGVGSSNFGVIHKDLGVEGYGGENSLEDLDTFWVNTPANPNDAWLVVYSSPYGVELSRDSRPDNSLTSIEITLAVILSRSEEANVDSGNNLLLELGSMEKSMDFSGKTITIKQTYPGEEGAYNVRDLIANDGGVIELPALNGTYKNGQIYAKFLIEFSE